MNKQNVIDVVEVTEAVRESDPEKHRRLTIPNPVKYIAMAAAGVVVIKCVHAANEKHQDN